VNLQNNQAKKYSVSGNGYESEKVLSPKLLHRVMAKEQTDTAVSGQTNLKLEGHKHFT
jgi:hypothetical protein